MKISQEEKKALKLDGYLPSRDGEHVAVRIITKNGVLSTEDMAIISSVAKKYGKNQIAFTSRLTVEIPWIKYEDVPFVKEIFAKSGIESGGTGPKVRPLVSCKGTYCVFGLLDTQGYTKELHELFYKGYRNVTFPHKVKIAVGGCPNNCVKPDLNDIGIVGQRVTVVDEDICKNCQKCLVESNCPIKAVKVENKKVIIDKSKCNNCGRCIGNCPFNAVKSTKDGCKIYVGGRWGKQISHAVALNGTYTLDEAKAVVEKALLLFKDQGYQGERFAVMMERLGADYVKNTLANDDLLLRKEEIISAPIKVK